jgi:two-component system, chemotaxis family, protein-glutamate methylesterase/glutaminase
MGVAHGKPGVGNRDVIVIGGSAGGVEAVTRLARGLPADFPAALLVAIHCGPDGPGWLAEILDAAGPLPAVIAEEGQPLERGRIHVAPPDRHLLVAGDHLHVRRGPRENRSRPAIDPLFRSAAVSCSTRVIGVVLSGMLNDGSSGLRAVKRCGGLAVVQDPRDAAYPDMPRNALIYADVDHVLPLAGLAPLLARLAASPRPPPLVEAPEEIRIEALIAAQELTVMPDQHNFGPLSSLGCPDCHGIMQEIREGGLVRYRCHTGHAFTLEVLRLAQGEAWERTLYAAMRAQQEQEMLCRRLAEEARGRGEARSEADFQRRAWDYQEGAGLIRQLVARGNGQGAGSTEVGLAP